MSCIKTNSTRDCWSHIYGNSIISNTMGINKLEKIKQFLHFTNNDNFIPRGQEHQDRLFKIRPIVESLRKSFREAPM